MPCRMTVYAVGAYGYDNFGDDCYTSVLGAKLSSIWPDSGIDFHRISSEPFSPDKHEAVILGGGGLFCRYVADCGTDNLAYFLRYPAAMHLFGKKSYGISLGVQGKFENHGFEALLPIIDKMALRAVRDSGSARMLREAGVRSPVHVCADLGYLLPIMPRVCESKPRKPLLGVVASQSDKNVVYPESIGFEERIAQAIHDLQRDFEIRYISVAPESFALQFREIDICLTSRLHGVILSVLNEIPFVGVGANGEKVQRECTALQHPSFLSFDSPASEFSAAVRTAWTERETLQAGLRIEKTRRLKLAARNLELLQAAQFTTSVDSNVSQHRPGKTGKTLVVWAAGDEFWNEAEHHFSTFGQFDCVLPSASRLNPGKAQRRFVLPAGTLMHWAMMPSEIKTEIEKGYGDVVLCHASNRGTPSHLVELGKACGNHIREYALWSNQCS